MSSTQDGPSSSVFVNPELKQRLQALQSAHDAVRAAAADASGCCSSGDAARQCEAAWQLLEMQQDVGLAALRMQQAARAVQRAAHANTQRLLFDQAAVHKAHRCLRLEQQAQLLQGCVGSRPYNRMPARVVL